MANLPRLAVLVLMFVSAGIDAAERINFRRKLSGAEKFNLQWLEFTSSILSDPQWTAAWEAAVQQARDVSPTEWEFPQPVFNCTDTAKSPTVPTSVHMLRLGDIDAVGAFGDSITAANGVGAEALLEVALENRAESWDVGTEQTLEEGVITIPNILKKFNPDVTGGSICRGVYGIPPDPRKAFLNVAEPGGTNEDMLDQAHMIVRRSLNDDRVDHNNDWKLITLFIGGNDLCGSCDTKYPNDTDPDMTPIMYRARIEASIDVLKAGLPRTLFNLVPMFDITPLLELSAVDAVCNISHRSFCECMVTHSADLKQRQWDYYLELQALVDSGKYEGSDDFTVVLQPMFVESVPPIDPDTGMMDRKFVSPDCFHPSRKAHQSFAYGLWNTMLTPVGQKPLFLDQTAYPAFKCPTAEDPYIFTNANSGSAKMGQKMKEDATNIAENP